MRTYQHWSTETLEFEKKKHLENIEEWERTLRDTNSFIIVWYLTKCVKTAKETIHAIDAELCYREHH